MAHYTSASLGIAPVDFGTHSIRKYAATYVATGSTACPPIVLICLRAKWKMPGVLNRYIKYKNTGDQFVGKCVSGRNRKRTNFAASPSYWDFLADDREDKEAFEKRLHSWLRDHLPEEAKENLKIFCVYKMTLAALVHHQEYIDKHLHMDISLRCSVFWTDNIPFPEKVVLKHPWDATDNTPMITGIPLDIVLFVKMKGVQRKMADLLADQKARFESTLID